MKQTINQFVMFFSGTEISFKPKLNILDFLQLRESKLKPCENVTLSCHIRHLYVIGCELPKQEVLEGKTFPKLCWYFLFYSAVLVLSFKRRSPFIIFLRFYSSGRAGRFYRTFLFAIYK